MEGPCFPRFSSFVAYINSLDNAFVADDIPGILNEENITEVSYIFAIPLVLARNFLNFIIANIFGRSPPASRTVNIFFHLGNVWLLYLLLHILIDHKTALFAVAVAVALALQKFNQGLFEQMSVQVPGRTDWSKETVLTYFQFGNFYWLVPPTLVAITKKAVIAFIASATLWLVLKHRRYSSTLQNLLPLAAVFITANLATSYAEFLSLYPYGGRHILPLLFFWLLIMAIFWDLILTKTHGFGGVLLLTFLVISVKYGPAFDRRQSFSNGYVEAIRLAVQQQFLTINFVNPDKEALAYLKQQYGQSLVISESDQLTAGVPNLVTLDFKNNLNTDFETLYVNPQGTTFLIQPLPSNP